MGGEDSFQLLSFVVHEVLWPAMPSSHRFGLRRGASKATRGRVALQELS